MIDLLWINRAPLQHACIVFLALFAFWRGAGPEKAVGIVFLSMLSISYAYHAFVPLDSDFRTIAPNDLLQDLVGLAGLYAISMYANRIYPLWLAAFQLLAALSHSNRVLSGLIDPYVYSLMVKLPLYLQLPLFALGLISHVRRERVFGPYRAWRHV